MSEEKQKQAEQKSERVVSYIPIGQTDPMELTFDFVANYLARPTRSGKRASAEEIVRFIMLCKAQRLNPWVGDAYIVGFDGKDGPEFSLITSASALRKRAESNPAFAGMESGIIVEDKNGELVDRSSAFRHPGDKLLGAWCRIHRKDREMPTEARVELAAFDKNRSLWLSMKPTMIQKCAVATAIREAFPNETAGLITDDEVGAEPAAGLEAGGAGGAVRIEQRRPTKSLEELAGEAVQAVQAPVQEAEEPAVEMDEPALSKAANTPKPEPKPSRPFAEPDTLFNQTKESEPEPAVTPASEPVADRQPEEIEQQRPAKERNPIEEIEDADLSDYCEFMVEGIQSAEDAEEIKSRLQSVRKTLLNSSMATEADRAKAIAGVQMIADAKLAQLG